MNEQETQPNIHEQVADPESAEVLEPKESLAEIAQRQLETKLVSVLRNIRALKANGSKSPDEIQASLDQLDELAHELIGQGIEKLELQLAKEIMGPDFFGPEQIQSAFLDQVDISEVPPIPFSPEELERAKELGQMLVLRVNKAKDGSALSMQKMQELLDGKMKDDVKPLRGDWYTAEELYTSEAPSASWALVSKEVVSDSPSKNYLQQTQVLVDYLRNEVFKDTDMSNEYKEAIEEFERERDGIAAIVLNNSESEWKEAAQRLEQLKINQLTRRSPVEILYDLMVCFQQTGERQLSDIYSWTNRRNSDGGLVCVGYFWSDGVRVYRYGPDLSDSGLGVSFSRSQ